ncbi:MAG: methionine--tRNA ligase [Candidatus Woesearchaeota archaeon]
MTKAKILVTSALPYVNNIPHLGNMICVVSADVYTRYCRLKQYDVISVLGTDEYGTTAQVKAQEEGITPQQLVDKYFAIHKDIYTWFNTQFDCLGRTSDKQNTIIAQDIFTHLDANGFILAETTQQMYDKQAQTFLADRFIQGTCPHCGFEQAKGDQCDQCGKLLNPEELKNPISTLTKTVPIQKETTHLYMDLPKIAPQLQTWIDTVSKHWSENAKTTTYAWLRDGLKPRAITRDLSWGIPVPKQGFEHKVLYSWFDAPIGYISITAQCRDDWKEWWFANDSVKLVQFMGKDNIPFHTILFPAFLLGTKQPYTLLDTLSVNEYVNYEQSKFSKSRGTGVFCDDAQKTGIPADVWRYYLMVNRPEKEDATFLWTDFQEKINKELLGNLGNLVHRTLTFVDKYFDKHIPVLSEKILVYEQEIQAIGNAYEQQELKKALKGVMSLSKKANQFFQEQQPWVLVKEQKADNVIANLVQCIADLAVLIQPVMPQVSADILGMLNIEQRIWKDMLTPLDGTINTPKALFTKLEDDQVVQFKEQFGEQKTLQDIDLRVAKIDKVHKHPKADKLYVLDVIIGNQKRTIVSGLVPYYTPEPLLGQHIILVYNLQPAVLRDVTSQGMLLASGDDAKVVTTDAPHGTIVTQAVAKTCSLDDVLKLQLYAKQGKVWYKQKALTVEGYTIQAHSEGNVR